MTEPYPLTDEQIQFYRQNGYVKLEDVLSLEELEGLRRSVDEVRQKKFNSSIEVSADKPEYEKVFVQKVNVWRVHEGIRAYTFNPKIADIARRLVGVERIRLWHDQILVKMPGDSKHTEWHQDYPYWPMNEMGQLSCWMALDDVDEDNGCMQFIPGSQRWGALDPIELDNPQDIFNMVPEKEIKELTPVPVPLKAGSCTFHNALTFHYAGPNRTERPRRAMVTIFMPDGVVYNGKPHVVTDSLDLEVGKPLAGHMFPILAQD
jgi:phytanoyl-CoA hydroxylase